VPKAYKNYAKVIAKILNIIYDWVCFNNIWENKP